MKTLRCYSEISSFFAVVMKRTKMVLTLLLKVMSATLIPKLWITKMLYTTYIPYLKLLNTCSSLFVPLHSCHTLAWGQRAGSAQEIASHGFTSYGASERILTWIILLGISCDISIPHLEIAKQKEVLPFGFLTQKVVWDTYTRNFTVSNHFMNRMCKQT